MRRGSIFLLILLAVCWAAGARAEVSVKADDPAREEQALARLEEISKGFAEAENPEALSALYLRRAEILLELDEMELARSDAFTALNRSATRTLRNDAWQLLTRISFERGFFYETLRRLTDTERLRPLTVDEQAMLGSALVGTGMAASGDAVFQRISGSLPLEWIYWHSAIKAKRILHQPDAARALLHDFMERTARQTDMELLFLEAVIEFEAGNGETAVTLARSAVADSQPHFREREAFIRSWIDLIEGLGDSSGNQSGLALRRQIAQAAPLTDFEAIEPDGIVESSGVIRSEAIYYGTQIVGLYLPPGETIKLKQRGPAVLRLNARLVEHESLFYEGSVAAHLTVKTGGREYRFPVPRMAKSIHNPVSGFQEAYFSPPVSYFLPLEETENPVTVSAAGSPISVEVATAAPMDAPYRTFLSDRDGIEDLTAKVPRDETPETDLYAGLHAAAAALSPGLFFNPRLALHELSRLERARPDLTWTAQAKRTVQRLMRWERLGAVLHSHGYETVEATGAGRDRFLRLRDELSPTNFQKGTYVLLSDEAPLRLVAQGGKNQSLVLALQAFNPYRAQDGGIESAGQIEILIGEQVAATHDLSFDRVATVALPQVGMEETEIRVRLRHAYSGTQVRVQCTDGLSGALLSPRLQSRIWVASADHPIHAALAGPASIRLQARWLQAGDGPRAEGIRIRILDRAGKPVHQEIHPLISKADPTVLLPGRNKQVGQEGRLDIAVDSTDSYRMEIAPEPASPDCYIAVVLTQFQQAGANVRSFRIKPIEQEIETVPPLLAPDRFAANENRIHRQSGGSFSLEGGYGRDDFDYADVSDQECCEGCGREYLEFAAAHRLFLREAWLHHRFEVGARDLFARPTVLRGRERLIWRPPVKPLRLVADDRLYTQQIDQNRAWTNHVLGMLEAPIGNDLFLATPAIGAFFKWTNVEKPTEPEKEKMEAYVYSDYLDDHPTGPDLELNLALRPFQGLRFYAGAAATGNPDFTLAPPDRLRPYAGCNFFAAGFKLSPRYQYSHYFEDDDRNGDFGRSEWSAGAEYGFWTPWGDRVVLVGKGGFMSDSRSASYAVGLRYDWLRGRLLDDYDSTEEVFLEQIESQAPQHGILERGGR